MHHDPATQSRRQPKRRCAQGDAVSTARHPALPNLLLEALPRGESQRIFGECEIVELGHGQVLYQSDAPIRHVYFPFDCCISLMMPIDGTSNLEVARIGNEGMLGSPLILGLNVSPLAALVQGDGIALRMDAAVFLRALERSEALRRELQRYLLVQMNELARIAACNRFHLVEQRLARCLLMTQDRAQSDTFHATQETLAYMLGVRRVGVTKAANALQARRLIDYHRGEISILDRAGMEAASCGCYRADREGYDGMMGTVRGLRSVPRRKSAIAR